MRRKTLADLGDFAGVALVLVDIQVMLHCKRGKLVEQDAATPIVVDLLENCRSVSARGVGHPRLDRIPLGYELGQFDAPVAVTVDLRERDVNFEVFSQRHEEGAELVKLNEVCTVSAVLPAAGNIEIFARVVCDFHRSFRREQRGTVEHRSHALVDLSEREQSVAIGVELVEERCAKLLLLQVVLVAW